MRRFPDIARLTEGLSILPLAFASAHDWNDVVENKIVRSAAPTAGNILPFFSLETGKVTSVALLLSRLRIATHSFKDFVAVDAPSFLEGCGHLGSRLWRMLKTFGRSSLLRGIGASTGSNKGQGFGRMGFAPKGVILAAHTGALALGLSTGFVNASENVGSPAIEQFSADHAGNGFATSDVWHLAPNDNRVNSGDNSTVSFQGCVVNPEPSRARSTRKGVRGAEGVTTRPCGNNNRPTNARRESDDIVWAAWRHAEASHKQACDNKSDDVLNISPSDVFTAAQFNFAQAACAVSISGLEMLQNAGAEKVIDLLDSRIGNAEKTMQNNLSLDCYSDGTASGGKQIGGLGLLVPDANTSGTVGGIDRASWSFWQTQKRSFATDGFTAGPSTIQTEMNRLWLQCMRQADRTDLIIADNNYYRFYWESLQAIQRIQSEETASAGYKALKFMDADVVADGGIGGGATANHMWFLNTDYIFLRPHKDRNMVPLSPDRFSVNQDAMVKLIAWAGAMTISNSELQGVLIA